MTLSVEGKWGSGKTSFMRLLEKEITAAEALQGTTPRSLRVWFNPWRHDKEQALWAAFALEFIEKIRAQRPVLRRWFADLSLFRQRYAWKNGWVDLTLAVALRLLFICASLTIPVVALLRGPAYVRAVTTALITASAEKASPLAGRVLDGLFGMSGILGCLAALAYLLLLFRRHVDNPLQADLQRHINCPAYRGSVSFVENFHKDFSKIVRAYAEHRRVYVFIDDLDRCEVPKAADLMQAINLMTSGDTQLVFIIGMDWETVAAGVATKNAGVIPFLKPGANQTEAALDFGRESIEKFVQLRFAIPEPASADMKRLLQSLSAPAGPRVDRRNSRITALLEGLRLRVTRSRHRMATLTGRPTPPQPGADAARRELIHFGVGTDSDTVQAVTLALMPAFENKPRRLKQFLALFRLRTYIAKQTGLFAVPDGAPQTEALTLEQLGKFTALEISCPAILSTALQGRPPLSVMEDDALSGRMTDDLQHRSRLILLAGLMPRGPNEVGGPSRWSMANVDLHALIRTSPYTGSFDAPGDTTPKENAESSTPRLVEDRPISRVLQVPRVPFAGNQQADFIEVRTNGLTGFNLSIAVPSDPYWRCGFMLAPDPYINEGRRDSEMLRHFLFHVGRGQPHAPSPIQDLNYNLFNQGRDLAHGKIELTPRIELSVVLDAESIYIFIGAIRLTERLQPKQRRHLYVLAWADGMPFHVPIEFKASRNPTPINPH